MAESLRLAKELRSWRDRAGLSGRELERIARRSNLPGTHGHFAAVERGEVPPSRDLVAFYEQVISGRLDRTEFEPGRLLTLGSKLRSNDRHRRSQPPTRRQRRCQGHSHSTRRASMFPFDFAMLL
jgi:transcriptional regulator with XRE-family HTH domain